MADDRLEVLVDLGIQSVEELGYEVRALLVRLPDSAGPVLTLKARSADAARLASALGEVTALSMSPGDDGVVVRAWSGGQELGVVARVPHVRADLAALAVSKGGAKRTSVWARELLWCRTVGVRVPQQAGNGAHGWPEASATLLRYAAPLKPQQMPMRMAEEVLRMASSVWSGVVEADGLDRPEVLDQVREEVCQRGAPEGLVDLLVERKRRNFPEDRWLLEVEDVAHQDGQVHVVVQARPLPA